MKKVYFVGFGAAVGLMIFGFVMAATPPAPAAPTKPIPPSPAAPTGTVSVTRGSCELNGGTFQTINSKKICVFERNSCPPGWVLYENWSETKATKCGPLAGPGVDVIDVCTEGDGCTTGFHGWGNIAREQCAYRAGDLQTEGKGVVCSPSKDVSCTAIATKIGCY